MERFVTSTYQNNVDVSSQATLYQSSSTITKTITTTITTAITTPKNNARCSIYPDISKIKFSNTYWQIFNNNGSNFHLHGAYFGGILQSMWKINLIYDIFN